MKFPLWELYCRSHYRQHYLWAGDLSDAGARAEAAHGERFDIRAFHDMLLWGGDLPLDLLEKRTDLWIAEHMHDE